LFIIESKYIAYALPLSTVVTFFSPLKHLPIPRVNAWGTQSGAIT